MKADRSHLKVNAKKKYRKKPPFSAQRRGLSINCCYLSGQWQWNFRRFCWLDFAVIDSYNGEIHEFSIICHGKDISAFAVDPCNVVKDFSAIDFIGRIKPVIDPNDIMIAADRQTAICTKGKDRIVNGLDVVNIFLQQNGRRKFRLIVGKRRNVESAAPKGVVLFYEIQCCIKGAILFDIICNFYGKKYGFCISGAKLSKSVITPAP